ncbi:MAG: hypothetical protein QXV18_05030 [Candidatus Nitrosocaldus sp.]
MSMAVKVYRSDGDIKRELLYEIRTSSSNDLFLILMNLLLKNFNIQVEVVDNSRIASNNSSSNNNGDTSSDDTIQDEYWFMNG